jgi:hypothetical protein
MDDRQKIARRLSGALGRKVDEAEIAAMHGDHVAFADGRAASLAPGNVAYLDGTWWRNGRQLTEVEVDRLRW